MNSKHAFLALSVFTLVSIAHGEREVFAPTKLAPVVDAGTIRLDNGTAGVPTLSFKSDTDTGLYRNGANTLSLTTNAVGKFHVTSSATPTVTIGDEPTISSIPLSGILRATSGSGTNIAGGNLTIQGGNSTGNAAGGYVAFQTAAAGAAGATNNTLTERMRITADGQTQISDGTAVSPGMTFLSDTDTGVFKATDNTLGITTGGTERMRITAAGDVGIGSTPTNRLNLTYNGVSGVATVGPNSTSGSTALTLGTSSSGTYAERMRIDSAGNVGIGTTTNLSTLTINGPIAPKGSTDVNAATYTVATTDSSLRFTTTNCTVTLPAAASFPGRILWLNTVTANSVTSNASNVIPLGSNTAGTAIFAATAGKFAMIQSNGTNWVTMMSN